MGKVEYVISHGRRIAVKTLNPLKPEEKIRRRRGDTFAMVPLEWAARAAIATNTPKAMVWVWLAYQAWRTKSRQFVAGNMALAGMGVTRKSKNAALRQLEAAGLIKVEWRKWKSPIVTLLRS
jgi:hypothetical protein